jgi:hypothetical protein
MSRSQNDGSFVRTTGTAAMRGIVLIAVAVVVGFVLLSSGLDDDGEEVSAVGEEETTTTTAEDGSTGTTASTTATTSAVPKPPNEVRVLVANGSGVAGAAGTLAEQLAAKNYIGLEPKNAAQNVPTTIVYFAEGFQREAAAVATAIGADPATVQAMPNPPPVAPGDLQDAHVIVVLGPDLASPSG